MSNIYIEYAEGCVFQIYTPRTVYDCIYTPPSLLITISLLICRQYFTMCSETMSYKVRTFSSRAYNV